MTSRTTRPKTWSCRTAAAIAAATATTTTRHPHTHTRGRTLVRRQTAAFAPFPRCTCESTTVFVSRSASARQRPLLPPPPLVSPCYFFLRIWTCQLSWQLCEKCCVQARTCARVVVLSSSSSSSSLCRFVICRVVSPLFREHILCGLRDRISLCVCVAPRASGNDNEVTRLAATFFFNLLVVILVYCMAVDDQS